MPHTKFSCFIDIYLVAFSCQGKCPSKLKAKMKSYAFFMGNPNHNR